MQIQADEFETLRAWTVILIRDAITIPTNLPVDLHPIALLDGMTQRSPAQARRGLATMIGDLLEDTAHLGPGEVARLDAAFGQSHIPSLTEMRLRFMKRIRGIVARGVIRSEDDYRLIRNAVEGLGEGPESAGMWVLLDNYEKRAAP